MYRHPRPPDEHSPGPHRHQPHPPHLRWDFPAPPYELLVAALDGDRELAYAASLALQNCPPEMRVLASLLLARRGLDTDASPPESQ